jgi:hypothetical protein
VSYLTAWRLGIGVLLISVVALAALQADLLLVTAFVLIGALVLCALMWPRAPWWGDHARELFADHERVRRETRRDLIYFGIFLFIVVVVGAMFGFIQAAGG